MRRFFGLFFLFFLATEPLQAEYYSLALKEWRIAKAAALFREPLEEAAWPTTVITEEERRRWGWFNLRDLLEYQPSFYLIQDVNERVVAHRGFYRTITSELLFLEDYIRLNLPELQSFLLDRAYSLAGVSRVEIMRGPGASLYGDAAFTGVVRVERKGLSPGLLQLGVGSYEGEEAALGLEKNLFRFGRLRFLLHYADDPGEIYHSPHGDFRIHPRPRNYSWQLRYFRGRLEAFWFHFYSRYDTPRSQSGIPLSSIDRYPFGSFEKLWQDTLGVKWESKWKRWRIVLKPYLRYFKIHTPQVRSTHAEGNFLALNIELLARAYGLSGEFYRKHHRGTFLWGFSWEKEDYERNRICTFNGTHFGTLDYPPKTEFHWSLFAQEKFRLGRKWILNLGGRYDHYESFGGEFSPRLSLIWKWRPEFTFSATWGRSFQAPVYFYRQKNRLSGYGATEELEAETLETLSLDLYYHPNPHYEIRLTWFQEKGEDLLVYNARERIYQNAGKIHLWGLEFESRYSTEPLLAFINYSTYQVTESDGAPAQGTRIHYLPRWMLKGGISIKIYSNFYFSPQFRWYGRSRGKGEWLSPYLIWDLHLLWNPHSWSLSFKAENLFDKHYFRGGTVPASPWPGRTFWLRLEKRF